MSFINTRQTNQSNALADTDAYPPSSPGTSTIPPEVLDIARILARVAVDEFFCRPVTGSESTTNVQKRQTARPT